MPAVALGAGAPMRGGLQRQFSDSASSLRAQAALGAVGQGKRRSGLRLGSEAGLAIAVPGGAAGWRASGAPASLPDMRLGEAGGLGGTDSEKGSLRSGGTMAQAHGMEEAASAQHPGTLVTKRSLSFDSQRGRRDGGTPGGVSGGGPGFHGAAPPKPGADELRHTAEPSASPGPLEDALARQTSAQVCIFAWCWVIVLTSWSSALSRRKGAVGALTCCCKCRARRLCRPSHVLPKL